MEVNILKKYSTLANFKKQNLRHARRSLSRKIAFKDYKRIKNKTKLGVPRPKRRKPRFKDNVRQYKKRVTAPSNFTLIGNPVPVLNFITKLKECFDREHTVFVILREVKNIDYDAIVLLLSIMVRFKSKKIDFNGDFPYDEKAKNILTESGFFKYLYKQFKDSDRYDISQKNDNLIHTHAQKDVDSVLSAKIIEQASQTIWNETRRCQGAQRTLIELMLNTNNHATLGIEGDKHWWLSVNHRKKENRVTFSFVDYGVGVFKSLENKPEGNKFYEALDKMMRVFKYENNAELIRLILNGDLHKTVTKEYFRGKGLPGIFDAFKRNSFSKLYIITNDVYADIEKGEFRNLNCNFSGTFIYFEINNTNLSCNECN